MKFINPRTDFAFKRIFGSEKSKRILMSFLNAILEFKGDKEITEVEILDPYVAPKIKGFKQTYLDLKVKTNGGKKIIIEMQVLNVKGFDKRVLYNLAKTYSNQIEKGEDYLQLNPVIALSITDFEMFPEQKDNKFISNFIFKEKEEHTKYNGDLEMVFLELPKFKKSLEELETIQDKWIYFMKEVDDMTVEPESYKKEDIFEEAFELANKINLSELELDELERESIFIQDKRGMIEFALDKGLEMGMEKGIQKGREEGIEEGKKKVTQEILEKLLKSGISMEDGKKMLDL